MAKNSLATSNSVELSVSVANELVTSVKDGLALVSKGYLAITPHVAKLYDGKAYKALGYKNFDEMCAMEFGMSHGTTVGIRKVFDKFGSRNTKTGAYSIPEKYMEYGYTKLLLFTDKKFDEAGINPINTFTPDQTMAEMKLTLTEKLEDKAKDQDKNAIDTTASEVENVSRETSDESTPDESTPDETERTDKELLNNIMSIAKELKERMNYVGAEKLGMLDDIIATAKELKKVAK